MSTPRLRDWQSRLHAAINARKALPFGWGQQDCCLLAAAGVEAVTGRTDVLEPFGSWTDAAGAARAIAAGGGLRAAVSSRLGAEIAPSMAQPGDVGLFLDGDRETLALWGGATWLSTGAHGLVIVRRAAILTAWRCTGRSDA